MAEILNEGRYMLKIKLKRQKSKFDISHFFESD